MHGVTVLVVDDEELIRWSLQRELSARGYQVGTADGVRSAMEVFESEPTDIVLLDIKLPDGDGIDLIPRLLQVRPETSIIMITSSVSVEKAVAAMQLGACDYQTKPFEFDKLWNSVARAAERGRLRETNQVLRHRAGRRFQIAAHSALMRRAVDWADRLARSDSTVLLLGESGVGKDVLAHYIHERSARSAGLLLDINCAALPDSLLESELFGHERGAFTDARSQKKGLFELAQGGTIYLDEIGDTPLSVQASS